MTQKTITGSAVSASSSASGEFAVIGASGKTGQRVVQRLRAAGHNVRALSRSSSTAFDWHHPATWPDALQGVQSLYITYQPDLAVAQAEADIRQLVRAAEDCGVEHLVLLSGRGEDGAQRAEQVLISSNLQWNVVRASWFAQNFSESFMAEGIISGELCLPAGAVQEPFVDTDDIADVVVSALTQPTLRNRVFEVTGPQLLTFADCVAEIAQQTGRTIHYRTVPADLWLAALAQQQVPADIRDLLQELFTQVLDGRNSQLTNGIQQALGRQPTSFAEYVSKTLKAGLWPVNERLTAAPVSA